MMDGSLKKLAIQVGTDSNATKSQIELKNDLFRRADVMALRAAKDTDADDEVARSGVTDAQMEASRNEFAKFCSGYDVENHRMTTNENEKPAKMLDKIDEMINIISDRITTLGAAQNRIESAIESIGVQSENITSSLSTLRDADVAQESSNYIKAQILQQASATLLATANQTPSIALNLL
jgi:flagellin